MLSQCRFCLFHNGRKSCAIVDCQFGEHFTVQGNAGFFAAANEAGIIDVVLFASGGNTMSISNISPMQTELSFVSQKSANAPKPAEKVDMRTAMTCPKCGSYAYVFDGKCRSCRDCGYKDGGCGA